MSFFDKYIALFQEADKLRKKGDILSAEKKYISSIEAGKKSSHWNQYGPPTSVFEELSKLYYHTERDQEALEILDDYISLAKKTDNLNEELVTLRNRIASGNFRRLTGKYKAKKKSQKTSKPHKDTSQSKDLPIHRKAAQPNSPDWYVSTSFGKSTSKNFPQAIALAKMAPQYMEQTIEGNIQHQAVYSERPKEYLKFIKLYELVKNWKSSFTVINGELVDRKIIGGTNYCYGDKCRSGKSDFCFGASDMTKNPFGCHRLQISEFNNPWYSFGTWDRSGVWHVNKEKIKERIMEMSRPYILCPSFCLEDTLQKLNNLPNKINPKNNPNFKVVGNKLISANRYNKTHKSITFEVNLDTSKSKKQIEDLNNKNKKQQASSSSGCLVSLFIIIIILLLFTLF